MWRFFHIPSWLFFQKRKNNNETNGQDNSSSIDDIIENEYVNVDTINRNNDIDQLRDIFCYKRTHRFQEILSTLQAKNTKVPDYVISAVKRKIQKEQPNGTRSVTIPKEVEEKLREMFEKIQDPFDRAKRDICPQRVSFMSYNFVLHKMLQLIGRDDLAIHFPMIKSHENLLIQEKLWEHICNQLGWEYK